MKKYHSDNEIELYQTLEDYICDCTFLKPKVGALEKCVLRIEEILQLAENEKYNSLDQTYIIQIDYLEEN